MERVVRAPVGGRRRAVEDYRRGAAGGDTRSMTSLAAMMRAGEGTPTDMAGAFAQLKDAAGRGDEPAMLGFAGAYRDGEGTTLSPADADSWFSRAAAANDAKAQRELAALLLDAPPEERDDSRALNLLFQLGRLEELRRSAGSRRSAAIPRCRTRSAIELSTFDGIIDVNASRRAGRATAHHPLPRREPGPRPRHHARH